MRSRTVSFFVLITLVLSSLAVANAQPAAPAQPAAGPVTLTLLHNNDGESSLLPLTNPVGDAAVPIGGIAAFKTLTEQNIAAARDAGHAVLNVYAGDAFLASSTLACSLPPRNEAVYDAIAQRQIPYDAHIFGNHEFDFSPDFLKRFIDTFEGTQPFLSANLDFSGEAAYAPLIDADGLLTLTKPMSGTVNAGRVLGRALVITDTATDAVFGIVSATTPTLPNISSPRNVQVTTETISQTAQVVQAEVDRMTGLGVNKIILVSHLQSVENDQELVGLLRDVDVAVAGGGDELLVNTAVPTTTQLLPGEQSEIGGEYPLIQQDSTGKDVPIVTTAGNYKYLGHLDVQFDAAGNASVVTNSSYARPVIPNSPEATQLGITNTVTPSQDLVTSVEQPVQDCLAALEEPIARTEIPLDVSRNAVRGRESNAGNLVTDAYLYTYDQQAVANALPERDATVIAIQNGGGIRQNAGDILPTDGSTPGPISRKNTLDVLAFLTNAVSTVRDVTPADLKQIMERSGSQVGGGQFMQIGGFRVLYDLSRTAQAIATDGTVTTPGDRVRSVTLSDGTAIISDGAVVAGAPNVSIVTNSFTADGGDNYPWLADNPNKVQFPLTYEQALVEYLLTFPAMQGLPTIPASDVRYQPGGEGRIALMSKRAFLPIITR